MKPLARGFALGLLLLAALGGAAAAPTADEIVRAIKQLGDDSFDARQKASAVLRAAGAAAEPALEQAAKSTDFEVSRRAREILEDFKWGIYPETAPKLLPHILRFRSGDEEAKQQAYDELLKVGITAFPTLVKLAAAEEDRDLRRALYAKLSQHVARLSGDLILEGKHAELERLLESALVGNDEAALRNYAAALLWRGTLDEHITRLKARVTKGETKRAETLFYLCRAKGDAAGMRWAAEQADNAALITAALVAGGDWAELARRWEKEKAAHHAVEWHSLALAYRRLADDAQGADQAAAAIRQHLAANPEDPQGLRQGPRALFLNNRAAEGLALLLQVKDYQAAIDVLCFQSKYAEAFALAAKAKDAPEEQRAGILLSHARALQQLGEGEQARTVFQQAAALAADRDDPPTTREVIAACLRLGLKEEAFAEAARQLKQAISTSRRDTVLAAIFPEEAAAAALWWGVLRHQFTADEAPAVLAKLRQLFEGKLPAKEFTELVAQAEKIARDPERRPDESTLWNAIAAAAAAAGQTAVQQTYLEKAAALPDGAAALERLGDLHAGRKEWPQAAERYRQAWEKDRSQPLPLFLRGAALVSAGQEAEGRKLMEAAHWLPLGNEHLRYPFAQALAQRGLSEPALRERQLILALGALDGWEGNEALRSLAYAAQGRQEFARAADLFEQFRLRCLSPRVNFFEYSAHVHVPGLVHQNRARAFLAAGKLDAARQEWALCLQLVPGNVNLPIQLVAALEKADRKADADALFNQVLAVHQKVCQDHPRSGSSHNTLAWLGAVCRRQLDLAQQHASKAVALEPANAGYLDTLAETEFQRGNTARALELMKRCRELDPKNAYFRKQIQRFEAGDPKVDVPDENE